jgi:hypothetical protein
VSRTRREATGCRFDRRGEDIKAKERGRQTSMERGPTGQFFDGIDREPAVTRCVWLIRVQFSLASSFTQRGDVADHNEKL